MTYGVPADRGLARLRRLGSGPRRTVGSWLLGDEVEVVGALRRRFYRGGQGTSTRLEVEVLRAKRLSRRHRST